MQSDSDVYAGKRDENAMRIIQYIMLPWRMLLYNNFEGEFLDYLDLLLSLYYYGSDSAQKIDILNEDPKQMLNNYCQEKRVSPPPIYTNLSTGPLNSPTWTSTVKVKGAAYASAGQGHLTKLAAENDAATTAMKHIDIGYYNAHS
ncbi:hypothetical protein SCHPADRAFT_890210 [Schizopora paradoxa]|uniref:DRBM domain-containing protein n=1 Tax=Schizopora paradoxa TaxID=27342 RepID=A0A0H2RMW3_9AGAM|nr:hypothetical protein SCHPADRAFT_890210 [Schizopora paradoxa]